MLTDKIRVNFKSGCGGDGYVSFFRSGKPSGGDGGIGGRIFIEGTTNLYDLRNLKHERSYKAKDGERGGDNRCSGEDGEDLIIKVPLTTIVYDIDGREVLRIEKNGERKLLLDSGAGGLGNHYFRKGQLATLNKHTKGKPGSEFKAFLELRLSADVIFIGFPNAGKSSMLNALTNASVAVASYPFTTIQPHLGVAENLILMDLPGLIEGTHEGKGLGTRFVRHTKDAKLTAHFISMENEDLLERYESMRAELKEIDEELYEKPELIVLTKSDMFEEEEIEEKQKQLAKLDKKIIITSAFKLNELKAITEAFNKEIGDAEVDAPA